MSSAMFSTLDATVETRKRRGFSLICGVLVQLSGLTAAVFLGLLFPGQLPVSGRRYTAVWLPDLTPPPKVVVKRTAPVVRMNRPKLDPPKVSAPLKIQMADLIIPKVRPRRPSDPAPAPVLMAVLTPTRMSLPPLPPAPAFQPPQAPKAPEQIPVHTGLFGGAREPVTTKRRAADVQTGGFGSPEGLPGHAQGGSSGNVPKVGLFGLPDGPGIGNGTGGAHGVQGVIASAGFGSGVAGMGNGHRGYGTAGPTVSTGGFEKVIQTASAPVKDSQVTRAIDFQPLEIISKPSPVYTEEARLSRIQGEVALSVVFQANGAIRVLGIVKPLGHGLDQAAVEAASQIRFKPALRDGKPADFPATLRIEFRLADQST